MSNFKGKNLKLWLRNQSRSLENGYMTEEKYKMLKTLGFDLKKSA